MRNSDGDTANVAGKEGDIDGGHRDQRVQQPRTKCCDNRQRQQDIGKAHEHIDAAHDDIVHAPAIKPGDHADGRPDGGRRHRRRKAHRQRQPRAPHQAAGEIATKMVGAQQGPFAKGFLEPLCRVGHIRVGQRQNGCQHRQQHHHRHHDEPRQREAVAGQKTQEAHALILGSRRLWATSTAMLKST